MINVILISFLMGLFGGIVGYGLESILSTSNGFKSIKMKNGTITYLLGAHNEYVSITNKEGEDEVFISRALDCKGTSMIKYARK